MFSGLDCWRSEILASRCTGMLHFLIGVFSPVDFLSLSMLGILCLNLEGAAALGLVLCYKALCWSESLCFCFSDSSKVRNHQYYREVTEGRVLEPVCIAGIQILLGLLS